MANLAAWTLARELYFANEAPGMRRWTNITRTAGKLPADERIGSLVTAVDGRFVARYDRVRLLAEGDVVRRARAPHVRAAVWIVTAALGRLDEPTPLQIRAAAWIATAVRIGRATPIELAVFAWLLRVSRSVSRRMSV